MKEHEAAEIRRAINTSQIFKLPKAKLEEIASWLATPNAYTYFLSHEFEAANKVVKMALENADKNTSATYASQKYDRQWYEKPLGIAFLAAIGAVLAYAILWVVYHYLGLKLN